MAFAAVCRRDVRLSMAIADPLGEKRVLPVSAASLVAAVQCNGSTGSPFHLAHSATAFRVVRRSRIRTRSACLLATEYTSSPGPVQKRRALPEFAPLRQTGSSLSG